MVINKPEPPLLPPPLTHATQLSEHLGHFRLLFEDALPSDLIGGDRLGSVNGLQLRHIRKERNAVHNWPSPPNSLLRSSATSSQRRLSPRTTAATAVHSGLKCRPGSCR